MLHNEVITAHIGLQSLQGIALYMTSKYLELRIYFMIKTVICFINVSILCAYLRGLYQLCQFYCLMTYLLLLLTCFVQLTVRLNYALKNCMLNFNMQKINKRMLLHNCTNLLVFFNHLFLFPPMFHIWLPSYSIITYAHIKKPVLSWVFGLCHL